MDIREFITARLDEDESAAHAATAGPWLIDEGDESPDHSLTIKGGPGQIPTVPGRETVVYSPHIWDETRPDFAHIARWDPARVLAEVAAKRELIKAAMGWGHDYHDDDTWFSCSQALLPVGQRTDPEDSEPGSGCSDDSRRGKPCDCGLDHRRNVILLPLAAPYADHPDYDPAWKSAR